MEFFLRIPFEASLYNMDYKPTPVAATGNRSTICVQNNRLLAASCTVDVV